MDEVRLRGALEIGTAVLLGLVSVATAAGAYQASEWAQQAGSYASIAGQLRDETLSTNVASQLASFDDADRIFDSLNLEFEIMDGGEEAAALREEQTTILEGGSPGLAEDWAEWVASGYAEDQYPGTDDGFVAGQLAPTYGSNRASAVAYELSDAIGDRGLQVAVASVVFALALLLLGVSGANRSLKVSFGLAVGGACAFVGGVVISVLALVG